MQTLIAIGVVVIGYIIGSIPFGLLIVKSKTGKDIRTIESGRTGGTNAVRAAGFGAGLLTAILDILKGAASVWLAQMILPENHLIHVLTPLAAILGHNYSVFLISRDETGKLRFHGGAGGAPALGGAMGLWLPIFPIVFLAGALVWFTLGIASVTTMAIGLVVIVVNHSRNEIDQPKNIQARKYSALKIVSTSHRRRRIRAYSLACFCFSGSSVVILDFRSWICISLRAKSLHHL